MSDVLTQVILPRTTRTFPRIRSKFFFIALIRDGGDEMLPKDADLEEILPMVLKRKRTSDPEDDASGD